MMEHLFDTHFHLDLQKDCAEAIREIEENHVYTIAVTNLPDLFKRESKEIFNKYIRLGLGFHPELVHQYKKQIPLMWDLLPSARYIGEVGLDYVDEMYKDEQLCFFRELIERCRYENGKILTIHSRRAVKDVLDVIDKDYQFKAILHWFTGNKADLVRAIEAGVYFSINSAMMASKKFVEMLPSIPDDRLLLETDSPFTFFKGSHLEALKKIEKDLKTYKPDVDLWGNFRKLLSD